MEADSADHGFENVRAQRFLKLSRRDGGVRVDGLLDVVAGETLRTALEALTPDPAVGDHRTPDQRRADALVLLAMVVPAMIALRLSHTVETFQRWARPWSQAALGLAGIVRMHPDRAPDIREALGQRLDADKGRGHAMPSG